ncbi:MAG TPA: hypothetical protein VHF26_08950, partial [Trebonia sp.]|nr:hypothetical protein [Trebonia sp.]
ASPGAAAGGGGQRGSAVIEFAGATARQAATGYLVAPDGTLYAGPLDGTAWHRVAALPCAPGPAANSGLPRDTLLAPAGTTSAGGTRLALVCAGPDAGDTTVYLSSDNGVTWAKQAGVGSSGLSHVGTPQSLTTLPDGTLILATEGSGPASGGTASQGTGSGDTGSGGIYLLAPGASQWRAATLSDPSGKRYGFTYVGMTSAAQGVALGGDPNLHAIWMTTDGGRTWQVRPIRSS